MGLDPAIRRSILAALARDREALVNGAALVAQLGVDPDLLEAHVDLMGEGGEVKVIKSIDGSWAARITSRGYLEAQSTDDEATEKGTAAETPAEPRLAALKRLDETWTELHKLVHRCAELSRVTVADEEQYRGLLKDAQVLYGGLSNVLGTAGMDQFGRRFDAFQHVLGLSSVSVILGGGSPQLPLWNNLWAVGASAIAQAIGRLEAQTSGGAKLAPEPASGMVSTANDPEEYFVAHEFSRAKMDDLRRAIAKALAGSGLKPYYADNEVREGHIFKDKILPKIRATRFGIYDISNPEKPNVFLELGAAIGMGKRYFIVCWKGTKIPADLEGLDRIEYESYSHLTKELKAKIALPPGGDH
jgi:hypothetical protein